MTTKPIIEKHRYPPRPAAFTDLPFIVDVKIAPRKTRRSYWHVQPIKDYGEANQVGVQYACDYLQYIKENPALIGSGCLEDIAKDMAKCASDSDTKGYAVGFWSFVEEMLYVAATKYDHYAMAEEKAQHWAALKAEADKEGDED